MRSVVIIFLWLAFSYSFFGAKNDIAKTGATNSASLYIGNIQLSTVDASLAKIEESVPLRLHVVQKPSVLTGLMVATVSVQITEEGGKKIGWFMEGVSTGSSSLWRGRTSPKLFPRLPGECAVNLEVHKEEIGVKGRLFSEDCSLSGDFDATLVDWEHISRKAMHWSIMLNLCTILEIRAFISQTATGRPLQVCVYSIGAIALCGIVEAALIVGLGMTYSLEFNTFSIVSLFKFVTFTLLHVSYLGALWKARLPRDADGNVDSAKITQLYIRFYMVTLIALLFVARFWTQLPVIVIFGQCTFAPQIVYDIYHGHRNSVTTSFVVLISICKLLPPLYLYGCPYTLFTGDPMPHVPGNDGHGNPWIAITLAVCALGLMGLAISQRAFGPRWFTPMICLPHVYNYVRQVDLKDGQPHECVICMSDIDTSLSISELSVTPCDHVFHKPCLEQWLEIKMECPTCRADLPPL